MPSAGCRGRLARHNKCFTTAGVYGRILVMDTLQCLTLVFFLCPSLIHTKHNPAYINMHKNAFKYISSQWTYRCKSTALPSDWQSCCVLSDWHLTHKCTHAYNFTLSPNVCVLTRTFFPIQINPLPLVGQSESQAFINWSTFIQLRSSLSLLSPGAVQTPKPFRDKPQSPCPSKTTHGPSFHASRS